MPVQPGDTIFGYRLIAPLGRGGMGTVYHARQLSLERDVAVKVIHPERLRDPQAWAEFLREARAAAQLDHPRLVRVHDAHAAAEHGVAMYAMELVRGQTADRIVRSQGPLTRDLALRVAEQVADALAFAHARGLVHRDVKPGNIILAADRSAKLLDLGLVRGPRDGRDPARDPAASRLRLIIVGTPDFAAPEQLRDPARAVPASDVWSLGATLAWLLSGRPPFAGETLLDAIIAAATDPPTLSPLITTDCAELIAWMLHKDPNQRPRDGAAARDAIATVIAGRPIGPAQTRSSARLAVRSGIRHRPWNR